MTGLSEQQLAEIDRLRDRVAELETYAYGCDAEGCVIPHSSWCEAAKKTAAENDGCTCGQPWKGHPQPHAMYCWTVNPPRNEVEEMRKRVAELEAERHSTNEAPSDAAEAIRAKDDRIAELETERALAYEYRLPLEGCGWLLVRQSAATHLWAVTTGGLRGRKVLTPDGWKVGALLAGDETYRWELDDAISAATREAFQLGGAL